MRTSELRRCFGPWLWIGVFALLPSIGATQRLSHLGVTALIAALAALGFYLPYSLGGQLTVAIGAVYGVAAFGSAWLAIHHGWNLGPALLVGAVLGFGAGLLAALPSLRTHGHYFLVVSFAVAELFVIIVRRNPSLNPGDAGLFIPVQSSIFGMDMGSRAAWIYLVGCLGVGVVALLAVLERSRLGIALVAARENQQLAESVGIRTASNNVAAMALGGAVTGLAGPLFAYYSRSVHIDSFSVSTAIELITILVIGGRRSLAGPFIGAAFVFLGPELIGLDPLDGQIAFGLLLLLVVLVLPDGIANAGRHMPRPWRFRRPASPVAGARQRQTSAPVELMSDGI